MNKLSESDKNFLRKYAGILNENVDEIRSISGQLLKVKEQILERLKTGYVKNQEAKDLLEKTEDQLDQMIYSLDQYYMNNKSADAWKNWDDNREDLNQ